MEDEKIKVMWNITSKCSFNCDICATYAPGRQELSFSDKTRALLSILSIKDSIREFNFAGGDPLQSEDSRRIIQYAMEHMEKNKVTVTTTGAGIEKLKASEKNILLNNCILTIDFSDIEQEGVRKSKDYNKGNLRKARENRKYMAKLEVNVPILRTDMDENDVNKMIKTINGIHPETVSLIKLMPVGKQKYESYPAIYNPQKIVEAFQRKLDKGINLHIHCALRCECGIADGCNMLEHKIGIDCAGNVFACCWAGYLDCQVQDNPYYLGNLMDNDLCDIIKNNRAQEIKEKINQRNCSIFEYLEEEKKVQTK